MEQPFEHQPGSPEAIAKVCTCPTQTGPGAAIEHDGTPGYACDKDCPIQDAPRGYSIQQVTLDQRRPEPRLQPIPLQFFTGAGPARQGSFAASEEGVVPAGEAAVTPSSREAISRSSPRKSRSTAAVLRCRDILSP